MWQALLDALRGIAGRGRKGSASCPWLWPRRPLIIPTDAQGDPVHPMITWLDRRTDDLVAAWQRDGTAERIPAAQRLASLPRPAAAGDRLGAPPSGPTSTRGRGATWARPTS